MSAMTEVSTAFVCPSHSQQMVSEQSSPGIIVLSRSLQLQYVNRRALELMRNLGQTMTESGLIMLPHQYSNFVIRSRKVSMLASRQISGSRSK